jgi:outer membrane lipoprotein carrier protein
MENAMSVRSWRIGRLFSASLLLSCSSVFLGSAALSAEAPPLKPPTASPAQSPTPSSTPSPTAAPAAPPSPTAQAAAAVPARAPVQEVVAQIQKYYERTTSLKARFSQTLLGAMGKRQASGGVALKKPGKMRWDYEKPEKKLFVADGTMLWMYEPEDEQAFRQPLVSSQLPAQVSFLFGRGKLLEEFDVSYLDSAPAGMKLGEAGDLLLKLVPKKASAQYRYLVFVVQPRTFVVKETLLYDQQGGTNHLVFSAIEANPKSGVEDSRFSFTPPVGTKIINPNH